MTFFYPFFAYFTFTPFMNFKTLENVSLADIVSTFNRAFADYTLPVQLSDETLRRKMIAENIDLSYSVGAFDQEKLIGFVLHGRDEIQGKELLYNGGAGIIPEYRGRGLTSKMYAFLLPRLKEEQFTACLLEVITNNQPAIRAYEKAGFQRLRELACFRGNAPIMDPQRFEEVEVHPLREKNYDGFQHCWNFEPTWQHNLPTMRRSANLTTGIGLFQKGQMAAYGIIDLQNGRVKQFGVAPNDRRKGYGTLLFHHMGQLNSPELSVLNVDTSDEATMAFLGALGFSVFTYQYEMELSL